jgi:hypothetical protein
VPQTAIRTIYPFAVSSIPRAQFIAWNILMQLCAGHPTLYANNGTALVPVEARYFKAYYNNIATAEIPFSTDFKAVTGNASATAAGQVDELWNMSWWCENGPQTTPDANGWPDAGCNLGRLQTQLQFPDCVNPTTRTPAARGWRTRTAAVVG